MKKKEKQLRHKMGSNVYSDVVRKVKNWLTTLVKKINKFTNPFAPCQKNQKLADSPQSLWLTQYGNGPLFVCHGSCAI